MSNWEYEMGFVVMPDVIDVQQCEGRPWAYSRDGHDMYATAHSAAYRRLTALEPWQTAWGRTPQTRD